MKLIRRLKEKAKGLKSELGVLIIAYKDKRTPLLPKILIAITVGYLLSPIDLIPDFIPVLGLVDDLIIASFLITVSIRLIPAEVLFDARQAAKNSPVVYKKKNWLFAVLIIATWLAIVLYLYRRFF